MIELNHVSVSLGKEKVISQTSFQFEETGLYIILGNNGVGKTTLLKSICGLQSLSKGYIEIGGKNISTLNLPQRSSLVQYVDDPFPIPSFINLEDYLILGYLREDKRMKEAISDLRIQNLQNKDVSTLSRGQQQKAMLAKLFYGDQPVWLMDEPSNYLDYPSLLQFWKKIQEKAEDKLVIATLHNPEEALKLNAQILVIRDGQLRRLKNPNLQQIMNELASKGEG